MMGFFRNSLLCGAVFSALGCVFAAAAPAPEDVAPEDGCLRFDQAVTLAALRAPTVAAARAEAAEAAATLKESRSLFRPRLSAFARTGLGDVGADNSVVQNQVGLRVSQRLFDFGDARFARAAARLAQQSRTFSVEQSMVAAASETGLTILERLEAEEQLAATADRRQYFERLLNAVDAMLARGAATRTERADVAARLAEAEALALELELFIESADTTISFETGSEQTPCNSQFAAAYLDIHGAAINHPDDASTLALSSNPALRAIVAQAESAEQARRREARARLPKIEAVAIGAYSSVEDGGAFEFQNRFGIDVSLPLYSGAALSARNDRAAARAALAVAEAARMRRDVDERSRIAVARRNSLREQLKSRQSVEDHKQDALSAAEIEHDKGLRTLPDLIELRVEYEEASIARIQTYFDLLRQQLDLLSITALLPVLKQ